MHTIKKLVLICLLANCLADGARAAEFNTGATTTTRQQAPAGKLSNQGIIAPPGGVKPVAFTCDTKSQAQTCICHGAVDCYNMGAAGVCRPGSYQDFGNGTIMCQKKSS